MSYRRVRDSNALGRGDPPAPAACRIHPPRTRGGSRHLRSPSIRYRAQPSSPIGEASAKGRREAPEGRRDVRISRATHFRDRLRNARLGRQDSRGTSALAETSGSRHRPAGDPSRFGEAPRTDAEEEEAHRKVLKRGRTCLPRGIDSSPEPTTLGLWTSGCLGKFRTTSVTGRWPSLSPPKIHPKELGILAKLSARAWIWRCCPLSRPRSVPVLCRKGLRPCPN